MGGAGAWLPWFCSAGRPQASRVSAERKGQGAQDTGLSTNASATAHCHRSSSPPRISRWSGGQEKGSGLRPWGRGTFSDAAQLARPGFLRGASGSVALWGRSGKDRDGDARWLPPAPRAPESSGRASLVRGRKRGEGRLPLLGGSVAVAVPRGPRRGSGMEGRAPHSTPVAKRRFRGTLWPGPAGPSPAAPSGLLGGSREAVSGAEGLLADLCGDRSAPLSADLTIRPPGQRHPGKLVASPIFGETRSSL